MTNAAIDTGKIRSLSGYPSFVVVAHTGFRIPCNSLTEAEAIKSRLDTRYPGETATVRVN